MDEKEFEVLSKDEMAELKGGEWIFVDGEWIWREDTR